MIFHSIFLSLCIVIFIAAVQFCYGQNISYLPGLREEVHTINRFVIFRRFFGGLSDVLRDFGDSGVEFVSVSHYKGTDEDVVNDGGTTPRTRKHAPYKQKKLQQVIQRDPVQDDFQEIHSAEYKPVSEPLGIICQITGLNSSHWRISRKHETQEITKEVCCVTNCQVEQDEA